MKYLIITSSIVIAILILLFYPTSPYKQITLGNTTLQLPKEYLSGSLPSSITGRGNNKMDKSFGVNLHVPIHHITKNTQSNNTSPDYLIVLVTPRNDEDDKIVRLRTLEELKPHNEPIVYFDETMQWYRGYAKISHPLFWGYYKDDPRINQEISNFRAHCGQPITKIEATDLSNVSCRSYVYFRGFRISYSATANYWVEDKLFGQKVKQLFASLEKTN